MPEDGEDKEVRRRTLVKAGKHSVSETIMPLATKQRPQIMVKLQHKQWRYQCVVTRHPVQHGLQPHTRFGASHT